MRLFVELIIAASLIIVAWERPFSQWFGAQSVSPAPVASPSRIMRVHPTPAQQDGKWMWDPKQRSTLDRPAYDSRDPKQGNGALDRPAYDPRDSQPASSTTPFSR